MSSPAFAFVDDLARLPPGLRGAVAAVGNFDGVHRGHQAVLDEAMALGRRLGRPVAALTFEPHPRSLFRPDLHLFRLTSPAARADLMRALGLDGLVVLPFTADLAARTAHEFVASVLVDGLGISGAVVGWDFHFGRNRGGSPLFLREEGAARGFVVEVVPAFTGEDGLPVSSSRIRAALSAGDLGLANGLLGYRWFVTSEVIHGAKRGRELGIPTANMALPADCALKHGVYAVRFHVDGVTHMGVASFGRRPQFDNGAPLLETYLIDFAGDLYGRTASVSLVSYLRPELTFSGVPALVAQMQADIAEARALLTTLPPGSPLDQALWTTP